MVLDFIKAISNHETSPRPPLCFIPLPSDQRTNWKSRDLFKLPGQIMSKSNWLPSLQSHENVKTSRQNEQNHYTSLTLYLNQSCMIVPSSKFIQIRPVMPDSGSARLRSVRVRMSMLVIVPRLVWFLACNLHLWSQCFFPSKSHSRSDFLWFPLCRSFRPIHTFISLLCLLHRHVDIIPLDLLHALTRILCHPARSRGARVRGGTDQTAQFRFRFSPPFPRSALYTQMDRLHDETFSFEPESEVVFSGAA